jgi:uncharacterized protein YjgD (DUF1641 family)
MTQISSLPDTRPLPRDPLLSALERIEGRLARLEATIQHLDRAASQAPGTLAALTDSLDEVARRLQDRGVDVDARGRALLVLAERLTEPGTLARLEQAVGLLVQVPRLSAAMTDTLDDLLAGLQDRGVDIDERLRTTAAVAERLTSPAAQSTVQTALEHVEDLQFLLQSGVLDRPVVRLIGELGQALAASAAEPPPPIGMLGAVRALSDPDIQRVVGFTLRLARRFGAALRKNNEPTLPRGLLQGDH